jgi:ABC-type bacteriocin/lantibiotic exporter with double-glycine peptidase domain
VSNPDRLEAIAQGLRHVAGKYTNAAGTLKQQAQNLDNHAQDLTCGIDLPESYIRTAANIDAEAGGYLSDAPGALDQLGLNTPYVYETNITINELETATANGDPAIVSVNAAFGPHAIVIDGIENDMVLIRDPAGSKYEVSIENFLKLWNGKAVVPNP